jgi:hypothetical protein
VAGHTGEGVGVALGLGETLGVPLGLAVSVGELHDARGATLVATARPGSAKSAPAPPRPPKPAIPAVTLMGAM